MNCHELHAHFEGCLQGEFSSEARSHLQACAECRALVDGRQELSSSLRLVRESVPTISEALDASVYSLYRQHMAEQRNPRAQSHSSWALRWSLAAATLVIVIWISWLATSRDRTAPNPEMAPKDAFTHIPMTAAGNPAPSAETVLSQPVRHSSRQKRTVKTPDASTVSSVHRAPQLPERFRSLMYCDELSCVGEMDVVRVQLPSAFVPRPVSAFPQPTGFVNADVLVGPDGIARGIRVEQ